MFTPPTTSLSAREEYFYKVEGVNKKSQPLIAVMRRHSGGSESKVAGFTRDYGNGTHVPFEPFRQLQDGQWRDYALIAAEYTRLSVLDLQTGEVIATEEYPKVPQWLAEQMPDQYEAGADLPSAGFCPMEFIVPDWNAQISELHSIRKRFVEEQGRTKEDDRDGILEAIQRKELATLEQDSLSHFSGQWGIYSGTLWGDEDNFKLRYVDLSQIQEGIVTTEKRFGEYVPIARLRGQKLDDIIRISNNGQIRVPVQLTFDVTTGKAPAWLRDFIAWDEGDTEM